MKLRANDNILVVKGRDKGKQGRIQRVLIAENKVLVEGVNVVLRHTKASANVRQAGIIQKELPLQAANVALICTQCNKPTRINFKILQDGTKARVCTRCEEVIE